MYLGRLVIGLYWPLCIVDFDVNIRIIHHGVSLNPWYTIPTSRFDCFFPVWLPWLPNEDSVL